MSSLPPFKDKLVSNVLPELLSTLAEPPFSIPEVGQYIIEFFIVKLVAKIIYYTVLSIVCQGWFLYCVSHPIPPCYF